MPSAIGLKTSLRPSPFGVNALGMYKPAGILYTVTFIVSVAKQPAAVLTVTTYWMLSFNIATGFAIALLFKPVEGLHK